MSLEAANPDINATVTASAGSGKTYMLVTRILRLLLEGADPGSILALTFTRKAAAEMQQRLSERLYQLATADEKQLPELLKALNLGDEYRLKARELYESHQYCDYPVRSLTFHSFCQDLLARFPLEANVPPNFNLLESSELLIQQAYDALFSETTLDMQGELAMHLQQLITQSDGLFNLHKILKSFLDHRSDWWAFTDGEANKVTFAQQQLLQTLELDKQQLNSGELEQHKIIAAFFSAQVIKQIKTYSKLLALNPTKTNLQKADKLASCFITDSYNEHTFYKIQACFIKKDGGIYALKDTPTLRKKLGDDSAENLLELHELIPARILNILELIKKINTYQLNSHWFYCGEKFIQHYQTLKSQQRLLDFTDLEWSSYKLLQDSDNALWIQYKLDQRIQHLLIDEFQDTNPTQWQLILPLLEEMAAAETENQRSVFLVGDEKQSIYSFRRAKPELQQKASQWLEQNLNARAFPLNKSWRSSPAIINIVNEVFLQDQYKVKMPTFVEHQTHHHELLGRVEALPLWHAKKPASHDTDSQSPESHSGKENVYCRNPLNQARAETQGIHQLEAQQIAQHIQQLIKNKTPIFEAQKSRPVNCNDIYILLRKRAHVADYEAALRDLGIAYIGTNRGTFLSCLEIQDMQALLETLLTPFNNLALAQVLKSPLFSATDSDLQLIAAFSSHRQELDSLAGNWFERLQPLAQTLDEQQPLYRAWFYLSAWRKLVDKIPVHDLLDKIFCDGDLLERYKRSSPQPLQARIQANLTLFLEMALDLDAGRYPSLMHFLYYLRSLKTTQGDAPDEAPMETREPRVRIMTIHASKGLEAPVVYLADTINSNRDKSGLSTLIDWPVESKRPSHFQLLPAKQQQDKITQHLNKQQKIAQEKEDANLLYVAITRARQYLFVSGCQPEKGPFINWYQPIFSALQSLSGNQQDSHLIYSFLDPSPCDLSTTPVTEKPLENQLQSVTIDPALTKIIPQTISNQSIIAPSYADNKAPLITGSNHHDNAQQRGIAIHRMLELLSLDTEETEEKRPRHSILERVGLELELEDNVLLKQCFDIAEKNIHHTGLKDLFHPENALKIYNECPIQYLLPNQDLSGERLVSGIIDRLIVNQNEVMIIDYKTHQHATPDNINDIAQAYLAQMNLYKTGVKSIWPDKPVKCYLLFTECQYLQLMQD